MRSQQQGHGRAEASGRRWLRASVLACVIVGQLLCGGARADRFDDLERATRDPSWRVRLQAAYVLSKQNDPRVVAILQRLPKDDHDSVRTIAQRAIDALRTPAVDPAAKQFGSRPGGMHIAIGGVGAKSKSISPDMTRKLRTLLLREFSRTPGLTVDGTPVSGFLIDSSITALSHKVTRDWIEVSCEISVVVGRLPSKAMVMMTSGGATVQEPKADFRPERADALDADALEGAVKGAHENLLAYLRNQR